MDEQIAAHMAELNVFRSQSILSGKTSMTKHTDGIKSYLEKRQGKTQTLSAKANPFAPQISQKEIKRDQLDTGTRPEVKNPSEFIHSEPMSIRCHEPMQQ